ncbi:DeoR/GlpR family DNA-binding transcription regulator [Halalkalibacter urbisdiaboli]|uniref:DeoR/GlpR family DNA-binding transcription regulator n=1 Tax=Halalkalibacter urbisdiaboli TaxID=1960589 RepID=UPI000B445965|nr:DeoR/GlpR family DNA-binding transcription regulator [Halalkalibacter urbisdiaboli]
MLAPSRRNRIMQKLREQKQITVKDTAREMNISVGTLRNDLKVLEEEGFLTRTHGGAILPKTFEKEFSFISRSETNIDEKRAIGKEALKLIEGKNCIIIDASSTGMELAKLLLDYKHLTVITNGLVTAQLLSQNPHITVIIVGGVVRTGSSEVEGLLGQSLLSQIHADLFFTSAHGFTSDLGMTEFSIYEAELKKAMGANADQIVVLMDHTKIGRKSIASSIEPSDIDVFITSKKSDSTFLNYLEEQHQINVVTAKIE